MKNCVILAIAAALFGCSDEPAPKVERHPPEWEAPPGRKVKALDGTPTRVEDVESSEPEQRQGQD